MSVTLKIPPSGSVNGLPIAVVAIASPGTLFHQASVKGGVAPSISTTLQDEIYLFLTNLDTSQRQATIQFGGLATPQQIIMPVPPLYTVQAIVGVPLSGGVDCRVFADVANKLNMFGYVNRVTQQ